MDKYTKLEELKSNINKCVLCAGCHAGCPTYQHSRMEHDSARGKVLLAGALMRGEIEPDKKLMEKFEHCLTCMNCREVCPAGAEPVKVINAARSEIFTRTNGNRTARYIYNSILPEKRFLSMFSKGMALATSIFRLLPSMPGLPFVKDGRKRIFPNFKLGNLKKDLPDVIPADGKPLLKAAYFTGCMADAAFHDTGKAVIDLLHSAGIEVHLFRDEVCCSAPAYFAGDHDSSKVMADKNIELFTSREVDLIVTSCATCGSMLKEIYPKIASHPKKEEFSEKIIDYQKLIADKLTEKIKYEKGGTPLRVTYHDPCHLNRGMNINKEPREILKKLPGVEFVEMENPGSCCGGAGSFALKFYGDSVDIGRSKGEAIAKSGADMVVTACPSCRMQLKDIATRYAPGVEVTDTAVLLGKLLKK
ncbi:MAG: (Fe-S)-binding protein [Nitrospinota bacterium]|nr:(Fe-S)-binding protein [Nitrospinota bacterium]